MRLAPVARCRDNQASEREDRLMDLDTGRLSMLCLFEPCLNPIQALNANGWSVNEPIARHATPYWDQEPSQT